MSERWWHETAGNVQVLAEALVEAGMICGVKELLYYYSKPWKFNVEWSWLQKHKTMDGFSGESAA